MKFLCVDCNEAMRLDETRGPDRGSMTVLFGCPACGRQTAMLTNSSETQVVRSLGVKIGGHALPAEPMEGIRNGLAAASVEAPASGPAVPAPAPASQDGASKCPFTGMVNAAFERSGMPWTEGALRRMENIPASARGMVMQGVERYAEAAGLAEVTEQALDEARRGMGM